MNDLPVITPPTDPIQGSTNKSNEPTVSSISYGGKEGESFSISPAELPLKGVGIEVDLPKEVQAVGVQVHPTTVQVPTIVASQGVQSVGQNVPVTPTSGSSISLPLTNDQIELALKKNTTQSIRWLAEWCVFQIKKMHEKIGQKESKLN
jgi:hypothetical protein